MNSKKLFSAVLAGAMALSLAVPAMAAAATTTESTGSQNYQFDATVNNATIKVNVPTALTNAVKLNPYQLAYTDSMGAEIKESIYSPAQYMTNMSDTAIGVTAAVKATPSTDVKLLANKTAFDAAQAAAGTKGDKNVYMYLEMVTVNDNMSAPTWATAYDAAKHLAILDNTASANGQQKKNIATMEAASGGMAAMEKGMVAFHFVGDANDATDDAWVAADKIALDITFTFTPLSTTTGVTPGADEAVTAGGGGGGGSVTTPSVSASITSGTPAASANLTLTAVPANIDASKNPTYSWAVTTDADSIIDSFTDGAAATQAVNIAAGAASGQTATLTVTVTYDDTGSQDATVTDTVTITIS